MTFGECFSFNSAFGFQLQHVLMVKLFVTTCMCLLFLFVDKIVKVQVNYLIKYLGPSYLALRRLEDYYEAMTSLMGAV